MKILNAQLVEQTLQDPEFLVQFPEFNVVHAEWTRVQTRTRTAGGCSSCAKRSARRRVASLFLSTLVALPAERRAAVRDYYGEDLKLEGLNQLRQPINATVRA